MCLFQTGLIALEFIKHQLHIIWSPSKDHAAYLIVVRVCLCLVACIKTPRAQRLDHSASNKLSSAKMSLTKVDKERVTAFWAKAAAKKEAIGADALARLVVVYPQTKTYFAHWKDVSPNSPNVKKHGVTVMNGIGEAVGKIDDLKAGLLELSELHAFTLRVDPANFKLISHCILVVLGIMFPTEFTPEVHVSTDKFLAAVARALSEKYR